MVDDFPNLVFRVGEYEVVEGLDLVVQVHLYTVSYIFRIYLVVHVHCTGTGTF